MKRTTLFHEPFDEQLKRETHEIVDHMEVSPGLEYRTKQLLLSQSQKRKELFFMKQTPKKRIAIIATLLCMTTVTVFGAGKVASISSHSSSIPEYKTIPTTKQLEKKLGFIPDIPQNLGETYPFESANIANDKAYDDNGNVVSKYKTLNVYYYLSRTNDQLSYLTLDIVPAKNVYGKADAIATEQYGDTTITYAKSDIKFVPAGYKLTEQDKQDEQDGNYTISYGSDKIELSSYQHVSWVKDDIDYTITASNLDLTQSDLMDMAKNVLNK